LETTPDLKYVKFLRTDAAQLAMRIDTPPFDDLRVRQALSLAVDHEAIVRDYFEGNAEILVWPILPGYGEFSSMNWSLDELPQATRELYEYHPDKARQLLAEAGYPDGFKTSVVMQSIHEDILSIIQSYLADVGVDLEFDVKEQGVWNSIAAKKTHEQMFIRYHAAHLPLRMLFYRAGTPQNVSMVNDPIFDKTYAEINAAWPDEAKQFSLFKELVPYMLEQSYVVPLPGEYVYTFWQPWIKGFAGERAPGRLSYFQVAQWLWIDQDLK